MDGVVKGLDKAMQSMDLEKVWNMNCILSHVSGVDPGFFLGLFASLRNGETDWWRKQIFKANMTKEGFWLGNNIMWTAVNTYQTIQQFFL